MTIMGVLMTAGLDIGLVYSYRGGVVMFGVTDNAPKCIYNSGIILESIDSSNKICSSGYDLGGKEVFCGKYRCEWLTLLILYTNSHSMEDNLVNHNLILKGI